MKIDTYTKLLHCALSLFVLTAAEHVVEETKGENKNPNTNNSLTAVIHLADFYHLSDDIGGIGDLISAFAPKDAANLAVTSKGFHRDHLTHYEKRLKKHGVSSVEIAEDPVKKMPGLVINGKPFGDLQDSDLLEILVKLGDTNAQEELCRSYRGNQNSELLLHLAKQGCKRAKRYVAEGYAFGYVKFTRDKNKLIAYENRGYKHAYAQVSASMGYAKGKCGFTQDTSQLLNLANQGWKHAQEYVAEGYARGQHGFTKDTNALQALASQGWESAQEYVAEGYANGQYGFTKDTNALQALANQGCKRAKRYVAEGYANGQYGFTKDTNALQALANQGWEPAQRYVAEGYAHGLHGFTKSKSKLLDLANQGHKYAQEYVAGWDAQSIDVFAHDLIKLLDLANQGHKYAQEAVLRHHVRNWRYAHQESVAMRHMRALYGFTQKINKGDLALAIKFRNNTLFHEYTETLPMKERIMFLLYSLRIDEHAKLTYG